MARNTQEALGVELQRVSSLPPDPNDQSPSGSFDFPRQLQTAPTLATLAEDPPRANTFWAKARSIRSLLWLLLPSSLFAILYCLFVYYVLVENNVETPGPVVWDASKTNYVVGVLSQFSAILTDATLKAFLVAVRPTLAAMGPGLPWASWTAQGASGWTSILQIAVANWFLNIWCLFRLALPFLSLGLGSVIKFQADFAYYFVPSQYSMPVYAGLVPPSDMRLLQAISPADLAMFLTTFSTSLLANTMYALPYSLPGCDGDCRSVILPGSVGMARQAGPYLNRSIYSTDYFSRSNTVRIASAPAMIIRYDPAAPSDLAFNLTTECLYAGAPFNNGLQLCFRQSNASLLVGWSGCPKPLLDTSQCNTGSPPPWRTNPITSGTVMTLFRLNATTSYDRATQAILDLTPLSSPSQIPLLAADYTSIFRTALIPSPTARPSDISNIHQLVYFATWVHRTWAKTFPDDRQSPVAVLQNLLAAPVQFAVTATVYANYSASERGEASPVKFPLPEGMRTVATAGEASSRLQIHRWAAGVFIVVDGVVHVVVLGWVVWFLVWYDGGEGEGEGESGVAEVDGIRAAARARVRGRDYLGLVLEGKTRKDSAWVMARENRGVRVREGFKFEG